MQKYRSFPVLFIALMLVSIGCAGLQPVTPQAADLPVCTDDSFATRFFRAGGNEQPEARILNTGMPPDQDIRDQQGFTHVERVLWRKEPKAHVMNASGTHFFCELREECVNANGNDAQCMNSRRCDRVCRLQ